MEFSLQAEKIFSIGSFNVTNSLFLSVLLVIAITIVAIIFSKKINYEKPGRFQLFLEYVIDSLRNVAIFTVGKEPSKKIFPLVFAIFTVGKEPSKKIFPLVFTFFTLIILSNWAGLLPITGPLGVIEEKHVKVEKTSDHSEVEEKKEVKHEEYTSIFDCLSKKCVINFSEGNIQILGEDKEFVPLFRPMTADLNGTVAFAIFSVFLTNYWGVKQNGFKYFKKYINIPRKFGMEPIIYFFVGILESLLELSKVLSFSFRLFGNVFAGEILLMAIYSLTKGVFSLPFLLLELFVGFIQAYVFYMLTISFTGLAVEKQSH